MRPIFFIVSLSVVLATSAASIAEDTKNSGDHSEDDHKWAIQAVRSGQAIPLARIIGTIEEDFEATVFEVDLIKSDDASVASIYRLKLVSEDGRLTELLVDTLSGEPVGIGGQGIPDDNE